MHKVHRATTSWFMRGTSSNRRMLRQADGREHRASASSDRSVEVAQLPRSPLGRRAARR